jgi:penicillin-insensitive murein endopeptidase
MRAAACLLALALAVPAGAEPLATRLFGAVTTPTPGAPDPIGSYARGCTGGNVEMPESGPTWQMMRLSRDRNWGNPVTVQFLQDLSAYAATQPGWKGLYIGDIGQPRGGPMASGHASHQIGLDADIWYLPPTSVTLSRNARETLGANTVQTANMTKVNSNWTPENAAILQQAAADPRVDRIFVAATVKLALCKTATAADTSWLQKLRPWYGHDDHFHVRLKCPAGATECETQTPTVSQISNGGSGCDASLTWWVTTYLEELKHPPKPTKPTAPPKPKQRGPREFILSDLPAKCADILAGR